MDQSPSSAPGAPFRPNRTGVPAKARDALARRGTAAVSLAVLGLFSVLVAAGVHGFSLGSWNDLVPDTVPSYSRPHLGTDRPIRADEWCVSTPQVLAQCASPDFFPRVNGRVANGTDMFVATPCNPVWDWTVPGQFHNWGYFLFGAERGLAWNWWCRFLGLPLFAYLVFLRWLGRGHALAAAASLAVTLGAPTQWADTTLPYLLLYFFSALFFLRPVVSADARAPAKALASAGLFVSLASYAFSGYPPFAVLLLPALLIAGWQTIRPDDRAEAPVPGAPKRRTALSGPGPWLAAVLLALAAEFAYCAAVHAETFRIIAGSSYPGARFVSGGSFPEFVRNRALDTVCLFHPWPAFKADPELLGLRNVCAAARYFVPGAALLALLAIRRRIALRLRRGDCLLLANGIWLLLWSALPFPRFLARATGMFRFPVNRAEVVGGFLLLLFAFRAFARSAPATQDRRRPAALAAAVSVAALALGLFLPAGSRAVFSTGVNALFALVGAILCAAVSFGLVSGSRRWFCGGYVALSILGGATVHPLSIGVSPLADKELAALVRSVDAREPGRWLANFSTTGNFLLAQGLDCYPGTQEYAHPDFWSEVDPTGRHKREWDRYAHCLVAIADGSGRPDPPKRNGSADRLRYSLTERNLRNLGVSHLVWTGRKLRFPWLRYEGRSRLHFVYTLLPESDAATDRGGGERQSPPGEDPRR